MVPQLFELLQYASVQSFKRVQRCSKRWEWSKPRD